MNEISVAEANRRFYEDYASRYDKVECCAASKSERAWLAGRIDRALKACGQPPSRVLDAGGGTGTAATILADRGLDPVVVDVSAEMLGEWERKAAMRGFPAHTVNRPIEEFLELEDQLWDLIVFSSVLHHLEDVDLVLRLAARRLSRGGVLTAHDPTRADPMSRFLRRLDWTTYALVNDRAMLRASVSARVERARAPGGESSHIGRIAERHALEGLDETSLAATLTAESVEVLEVDRQTAARHAVIRGAYRFFRRGSNFSILARRP